MPPEHEAEVEVTHWFDIDAQIRLLAKAEADRHETEKNKKNYVVMLTADHADGGKRATLAFSAACAALAMELKATVFLIGDGSHWAYEGASDEIATKGFPPLAELIETFLELGGDIYICAACDQVCSLPDEVGTVKQRHPAIQPRGLAAILTLMVGGTSVTF
jgi:predicted peroxiredoxin